MSDAIHQSRRPQGEWQIIRCQPAAAPQPQTFSWRGFWRGLQQCFRLMVGCRIIKNICSICDSIIPISRR